MFLIKKYVNYILNNLLEKTIYRKIYNKKIEYIDFKKLLENKRVCLVGPAEYIDKEFVNHGKVIDSYDIVVKLNSFIKTDKSLFQNYGEKMDILITSLWYDPLATFCHKETYTKENINKPLLIYYQNGRLKKLFKLFFKINENITICEQPKENFKELFNMLKYSPTTGMLAIFECLKCNPRELYITGMTFGHDVKYRTYVDKYYKDFIQDENINDAKRNTGAHNMVAEFNLTKKLMANNNIVVDNYLKTEIFHI